MPAEEFRDIPGFPGYRVSNLGNVESCHTRRRVAGVKGTIAAMTSNWHRMTTTGHGDHGHVLMTLRKDAKAHYVGLHVLVLIAFVGPRPPGMECRHLNGNAGDNRLDNLKWGTRSENRKDAIAHGTMPQMGKGEKHASAKLKNSQVLEIKKMLKEGKSTGRAIAKMFGVSEITISDIKRGRRWGHLKETI